MALTKRVVPCLDVAGGRVVKGTRFVSTRDAGDPVALAARYGAEGADELVFLDITASPEGRGTTLGMVRDVSRVLDIPFTVGGGISTLQHARDMLLSGADKVAINTGAVRDPSVLTGLMDQFGRQCVVVAIDAKRNRGGGPGGSALEDAGGRFWFEVYVYGGRRATGLDAVEWAARAQEMGAGEVLLTSIDRDGTGDGYDLPLTSAVADAVTVPVVASGGCGGPEHMAEVLAETGAGAALAASIFHYGSHGIPRVKRFLLERGVPVRPP